MKIAFLSNKLTIRGTEVALYDYAHYNEVYLGNQSIIITRDYEYLKKNNELQDVEKKVYDKFNKRFEVHYYENKNDIDNIIILNNVKYLYVIKYGINDGLYSIYCKNIIHCVFNLSDPHGNIYVPIGNFLNKQFNTNYTVFPHIVDVPDIKEDLRNELNIPKDAVVFGRYGGYDTFNIDFVKECIIDICNNNTNRYFIFMNTEKFVEHNHLIFLEANEDCVFKRKFINTCNALLHARIQGETFGLTCGEFDICDKKVITYGKSNETEHINILKNKAIIYHNKEELYNILINYNEDKYKHNNDIIGYKEFSPKNVMEIFKKFLLI